MLYKTDYIIERIKDVYHVKDLNELTKRQWKKISGESEYFEKRLNPEFIEMFADKLDWDILSKKQNLSEDFIEKHADKINWDLLQLYNKSYAFVEKHFNKIKDRIVNTPTLFTLMSKKLLRKFKNEIDFNEVLRSNVVIGRSFSHKYIPFFSDEEFLEGLIREGKIDDTYENWKLISELFTLSENFIEKYADKLNWEKISQYQKMSEPFIEKHADRIEWNEIGKSQKLSDGFIEKHINKLNMEYIWTFQEMSEDFIRKIIKEYPDRVEWKELSQYQKLSEDFIKDFYGRLDKHHFLHNTKTFMTFYYIRAWKELYGNHEISSSYFKEKIIPFLEYRKIDSLEDFIEKQKITDILFILQNRSPKLKDFKNSLKYTLTSPARWRSFVKNRKEEYQHMFNNPSVAEAKVKQDMFFIYEQVEKFGTETLLKSVEKALKKAVKEKDKDIEP